jgi:hypothetical protein
LIRLCFAFRRCSNKNYSVTVQIDGTGISDESIRAWFCTCATARRVLRCCAHITALILHLGVCRASILYEEHELSASRFLLLIQDNLQYPDTEHSVDVTKNSTDTDNDHGERVYNRIPLIDIRLLNIFFNEFVLFNVHPYPFLTGSDNVDCHYVFDPSSVILVNEISIFSEWLWIAPENCYLTWCFPVYDLRQSDLCCDGTRSFFTWTMFKRICKIEHMQCVELGNGFRNPCHQDTDR